MFRVMDLRVELKTVTGSLVSPPHVRIPLQVLLELYVVLLVCHDRLLYIIQS